MTEQEKLAKRLNGAIDEMGRAFDWLSLVFGIIFIFAVGAGLFDVLVSAAGGK